MLCWLKRMTLISYISTCCWRIGAVTNLPLRLTSVLIEVGHSTNTMTIASLDSVMEVIYSNIGDKIKLKNYLESVKNSTVSGVQPVSVILVCLSTVWIPCHCFIRVVNGQISLPLYLYEKQTKKLYLTTRKKHG